MYMCSSRSECDQLRSTNGKLTDELAQMKEKYTSQLKTGVRIKTEVQCTCTVQYDAKYSGTPLNRTPEMRTSRFNGQYSQAPNAFPYMYIAIHFNL